MMGPLNIIGLVGFWGTASRIFTLRQGKRLFGIIDGGQVIGIIIASYGKIRLDYKLFGKSLAEY